MFIALFFSQSPLLTKHKHDPICYIPLLRYATWFKIANVVPFFKFSATKYLCYHMNEDIC